MKELGYLLFAFIFWICRLFPLQRQKVVLFNGHGRGLSGNLLEMQKEILKREPKTKFFCLSKRDAFSGGGFFGKGKGIVSFFIILPYQMATAGRIFLNDNFLPLAYCHLSKKAQVIQMWHGAGAFKKFGLSVEADEGVRKQVVRANSKITHLFVTSQKVIPYYQEAFGMPAEKIFATGIPITDIYLKEEEKEAAKKRFYSIYPMLQDKKILLFTPTFRKDEEGNRNMLERFPVERIHQVLGEEWVILVRLHPKYPSNLIEETEYCYNLTSYPQVSDLFFVSDALITDYSSTIVEYVLLDKPVVLYAFDLKKYDRGFYRDYETTVPGIVAHDEEELLRVVAREQKDSSKRRSFVRLQYDYVDDKASERIWNTLNTTRVE